MVVEVSSITIRLSALELTELLVELNISLRKSDHKLDDRIIKNHNELCEICDRKDLIIY